MQKQLVTAASSSWLFAWTIALNCSNTCVILQYDASKDPLYPTRLAYLASYA